MSSHDLFRVVMYGCAFAMLSAGAGPAAAQVVFDSPWGTDRDVAVNDDRTPWYSFFGLGSEAWLPRDGSLPMVGGLTISPTSPDDENVIKFVSPDAAAGDFNLTYTVAPNSGSPRGNAAFTWGYNNSFDGGREVLAEPALCHRIESYYRPSPDTGPGGPYLEAHLQYTATDGNIYRPQSLLVRRGVTPPVFFGALEHHTLTISTPGTLANPGLARLFMTFSRTGSVNYAHLHNDATNNTLLTAAANNRPFLQQLNATGTAYVSLPYVNSSNRLQVDTDVTLADQVDFALSTTTGSMIGTAATQKLGFWGATPKVQPSGANQAAVSAPATFTVANNTFANLAVSSTYRRSEVEALRDTCEQLADDCRALRDKVAEYERLLTELRRVMVETGIMKGSP